MKYYILPKSQIKKTIPVQTYKGANFAPMVHTPIPEVFDENATNNIEDHYDYFQVSTDNIETIELIRKNFKDYKEFTNQADVDAEAAIILAGGQPSNINKQFIRSSIIKDVEGRRFKGTSILEATVPTKVVEDTFTETTHVYIMLADREIDGVRFKAYNCNWKNKVRFQVTLADDTVVDDFVEGDGWHLDEPTTITIYRSKLQAGMKIKMFIKNYADAPFDIWVDAFFHSYPA